MRTSNLLCNSRALTNVMIRDIKKINAVTALVLFVIFLNYLLNPTRKAVLHKDNNYHCLYQFNILILPSKTNNVSKTIENSCLC